MIYHITLVGYSTYVVEKLAELRFFGKNPSQVATAITHSYLLRSIDPSEFTRKKPTPAHVLEAIVKEKELATDKDATLQRMINNWVMNNSRILSNYGMNREDAMRKKYIADNGYHGKYLNITIHIP